MRHLARTRGIYYLPIWLSLRMSGFYGISEDEHSQCDMIAYACEEWRNDYTRLVYSPHFVSIDKT
jgi:hypothetical protein